MVEYILDIVNIYGYGAATISDQSIYGICSTDDRKVAQCDIISNVDVKLSNVLNGRFKIMFQDKSKKDKFILQIH